MDRAAGDATYSHRKDTTSMTTAQAIDAVFASELSAIDEAATKAAQKVERERAKLTRSDGSPVYSPAEQAEQVKAIYAAAAAEFDQVTARYIEHADRERVKAEAALAELSGDAFDRLSAPGQAKAAARREFVKEDCETLPVFELAPLAQIGRAHV